MSLEECLEIAKKYYEPLGEVLSSVAEYEESYLICGTRPEGGTKFGGSPILVDRNSGEVRRLHLPNTENFRIMREARPLELPEAYR